MMEMEDFNFAEMMAKIVMDAGRKKARRDASQQAVARVVDRVDRFKGDEDPKILTAYNAEMTKWGVDEATRLEYFCRVVAVSMHEEVKELRKVHESWESFEEALLEAYGYAKPEWLCRQHEKKRSATTRPASGGDESVVCDYALPPEESSPCNGLDEFNLEALIREVYEIVKAQIEAEEGFTKEVGSRDSEGAEEDTSLRTEDGAYKEAGRTYGGDMREGAERATLSYYGKGTGWRRPGTTKR